MEADSENQFSFDGHVTVTVFQPFLVSVETPCPVLLGYSASRAHALIFFFAPFLWTKTHLVIFIPPWGTKPVRLPRYTNIESLWDVIAIFLKEKVMPLSAFGVLKISCGKQSTYHLIIIIYIPQTFFFSFLSVFKTKLGRQVRFFHSSLTFICGSEDTLHTFKVQSQTIELQ